MSKIGKKPITIPQGVEVKNEGRALEAKGPKGTLRLELDEQIGVEMKEGVIEVKKIGNGREASARWGLMRALISNVLVGVSEGFEKKLELQGVGYRMAVQGKKLVMSLGFSHPVEMEIPENLKVVVAENNILSIWGIDRQVVGQFAANVRKLKKVEPYKGKGFRYSGEKVIRKVGKKAGAVK